MCFLISCTMFRNFWSMMKQHLLIMKTCVHLSVENNVSIVSGVPPRELLLWPHYATCIELEALCQHLCVHLNVLCVLRNIVPLFSSNENA